MKPNAPRSVHEVHENDQFDATNRPVPTAEDEFAPSPEPEPDDPSDLDMIDLDDERWETFLADDDELDPTPEPGDFWPDSD